jgi:hypothetical protein
LKDLQEEQQREREDLLETIRELTSDLKLQNAIINAFIPENDQAIIHHNAEYDEMAEKWRYVHSNTLGFLRSLTLVITLEIKGHWYQEKYKSPVNFPLKMMFKIKFKSQIGTQCAYFLQFFSRMIFLD